MDAGGGEMEQTRTLGWRRVYMSDFAGKGDEFVQLLQDQEMLTYRFFLPPQDRIGR